MGEFPEGAAIIPNPFNRIPGFRVGSHWFLPGFPVMAWPMAENALDTFYRDPALRSIRIERGFVVFDTPESAVTPMLEDIENRFAGVSVFCLPSSGADGQRRYLEVGVKGKGPAQRIDAACRALRASIESLGSEIRDSV